MEELMTLDEVANYLRVTKKTIYRLIKVGEMPASKIGHQWRFERNLVDEWMHRSVPLKKAACILVVDDEEVVRSIFKDTLEELEHFVAVAATASEGLELLKRNDFDLVFLDLKMPGSDGAELFSRIRAIKPDIQVIIITGYPDSEIMTRALAQGPFGVMKKPFGESDIINTVNTFLRLTSHNIPSISGEFR